ncbi:MAG: A/G-specific adenine glycosylase [Pseudomonadota bacterium]|jgi:A/G-specific adenine glycosylase
MATEPAPAADFAARLLAWFDRCGRRDLPWQHPRSPYRVWLSEIMLQQTRVETVIPYFERFTAAFPNLPSLARAPLDEVLHLWTGLGYYARARNLHRAAQLVVDRHGGELPGDPDALQALPGIGRSTAGAILALAWQRRVPILDGNVKRVLTRHRAIPGWPGEAAVARELWALADRLTPEQRVADYTQAIMDLGATLCTRTRPTCGRCPVAGDCRARALAEQARYPGRRPRAQLPRRRSLWLILRNAAGEVLLERRPPSGIWGGLWSFPEPAPDAEDGEIAVEQVCAGLGCTPAAEARPGPAGHQVFTHFRLDYRTLEIEVTATAAVADGQFRRWVDPAAPGALGLPAPVRQLLEILAASTPDPVRRTPGYTLGSPEPEILP